MSHDFYMKEAFKVANTSRCKHRKVGAIVVAKDGEAYMGYNYIHHNFCKTNCYRDDHKIPNGTAGHCYALHAEQNAILDAIQYSDLRGGTIYVTHSPCIECAKMIAYVGITTVVYAFDYPDSMGRQYLEDVGVKCVRWAV